MRLPLPAVPLAALFLVGPAARAQEPPGPAAGGAGQGASQPPAPAGARAVALVIPPAPLGARFIHSGPKTIVDLPNPAVTVSAGQQAHDAYTALLRLLLPGPPGPGEPPRLVITAVEPDVDMVGGGWMASVEHALSLQAPGGEEIAAFRVRGEAPVLGGSASAVTLALFQACQQAAGTFAVDLRASGTATRWLAERGIQLAPASALPPPPRRIAPVPPPVLALRSPRILGLDLGVGLVQAPDRLSTSLALRGTMTHGWLVLQVGLDAWKTTFPVEPAGAWGGAEAEALMLCWSVDAGGRLTFGEGFEFVGGLGATLQTGSASASYVLLSDPSTGATQRDSASAVGGSVFGQARYLVQVPGTGIRARLAVELRQRFGGALTFSGFGRTLQTDGLTASLLLGAEIPWGTAPAPAATAP